MECFSTFRGAAWMREQLATSLPVSQVAAQLGISTAAVKLLITHGAGPARIRLRAVRMGGGFRVFQREMAAFEAAIRASGVSLKELAL